MLADAINSVLAQTYPVHELIVVDDGSSDGSGSWIRETYPLVKLIQQANHGVSHARNQGIKHASGAWIALLDSDDRWYPEKLQKQVFCIDNEPNTRLCHCDEHWLRNGIRVNAMVKHKKYGGEIFVHCLPLCVISPSAALLHKSVFSQYGGFDETLPACEDYDFWLRFCSQEKVVYVNQALLEKRGGHPDQLSQQYWGMDRFRLKSIANLMDSNTLSNEQQALAVAVFRRKHRIYVSGALKRNKHAEVDALNRLYCKWLENHSI